jgi:hypothetical protein
MGKLYTSRPSVVVKLKPSIMAQRETRANSRTTNGRGINASDYGRWPVRRA